MADSTKPHPADVALKKAVKLKGFQLHKMPGGYFALYKKTGRHTIEPISAWLRASEVANYLGARGSVTLREALAKDGIAWPE